MGRSFDSSSCVAIVHKRHDRFVSIYRITACVLCVSVCCDVCMWRAIKVLCPTGRHYQGMVKDGNAPLSESWGSMMLWWQREHLSLPDTPLTKKQKPMKRMKNTKSFIWSTSQQKSRMKQVIKNDGHPGGFEPPRGRAPVEHSRPFHKQPRLLLSLPP